jgi:hypothetical protein
MNEIVREAASAAATRRRIKLNPERANSTATITSVASGVGSLATKKGGPSRNIESAVYGYIRAMRTLGRTSLNTDEIATALGLSKEQVNMSVKELRNKGVKLAKK